MIRNAFGSELDTSVDEAFGSFEFPIEFEFEIAKGFFGGQEVVFFLPLGQRSRRKRFVFDAPNGLDITFPAFEGLAIEERFGGLCFGGLRYRGLCVGDRGKVSQADRIREQEGRDEQCICKKSREES